MPFDQKLRELRLENEMTQKYVAARLKVARSTIAGYETKCRQPSHENLTALANLFHVSIDYLLDAETAVRAPSARADIRSSEERRFLARYSRLSRRSKNDLNEYMRFLEMRDRA